MRNRRETTVSTYETAQPTAPQPRGVYLERKALDTTGEPTTVYVETHLMFAGTDSNDIRWWRISGTVLPADGLHLSNPLPPLTGISGFHTAEQILTKSEGAPE